MKEILSEYQWLVGLIIGFFLNQIAVSLDRKRKKKDAKTTFKKHVLFIKNQLNYLSMELERIPYVTLVNEEYKNSFVKSLENIRNEIISIDRESIPEILTQEVTEFADDLLFFINSIKSSVLGKEIFWLEESLEVAKEAAVRQRVNVTKIFDCLGIDYK